MFAAVAAVVRPGGYLSVVTSNPAAAILIRAVTGDLAAALTLLRSDAGGLTLNLDRLRRLSTDAGLEVVLEQGLGAISATVPGSIVAGKPRGAEMLAELDQLAAGRSPFREIANQLHLIAGRPPLDGPSDGRSADLPRESARPTETTAPVRSCTWTWTPSSPASKSGVAPSCGANQ